MKRKLFAITMAAVLLLAGCGGGSSNGAAAPGAPGATTGPSGEYQAENDSWAAEDSWDQGAEAAPDAPMDVGSSVYQRPDAKLIRRAALEIQTEQFDQSKEALDRLVDSCEGYFENASVYSGGRLRQPQRGICHPGPGGEIQPVFVQHRGPGLCGPQR